MRFVIAGAGAVGGYIGAMMARAGQDVVLYARGAQLAAIRERGVRIREDQGEFTVCPKATGNLEEIGPADVVMLAVKAHSLPGLAPRLAPVLGPETTVVALQNGVPWWYFPDLKLERVDPGGVIARSIERRRVVGGIIYFSTENVEPGVIRHVAGDRVSLGEPDGSRSERVRAISRALVTAGLRGPITTHIREEIWAKILGNVAFNPISALTRATMAGILRDPGTRELLRAIMTEAEAVAVKLGMQLPVTVEQRIEGAAKVGEHKTSMLQDLEAGRALELEAIVGAVLEIAENVGVAMPHTRTVYACTRLLELSRDRRERPGAS